MTIAAATWCSVVRQGCLPDGRLCDGVEHQHADLEQQHARMMGQCIAEQ